VDVIVIAVEIGGIPAAVAAITTVATIAIAIAAITIMPRKAIAGHIPWITKAEVQDHTGSITKVIVPGIMPVRRITMEP